MANKMDPPTVPAPPHLSFASMSLPSIQKLLDERIATLSVPWKATIPFPLFIVDRLTIPNANIFNFDIETADICSFLDGQRKDIARLYFCPVKYPPPTNDEEMKGKETDNKCSGWQRLKKDLENTEML